MNGKLQLDTPTKARKAKGLCTNSPKPIPKWIILASQGIRIVHALAIFAVLTLCLADYASASEILTETVQENSGTGFNWTSISAILCLPIIALISYSLVVNQRKGWGWIVVAMVLILILAVLQFFWMIITSLRGDPLDNEDYFTPTDSWSSDSF